ncbi:hypothetical protein LWI28_000393 [Acer negundo]|uniref:Uncharacterized protein n=1 Tax=Acer negundo TaxID=4023 RepID=A0AAD5JKS9_ACENE|nr:hypothetical protein LWI28_000393 [Acer negundo]
MSPTSNRKGVLRPQIREQTLCSLGTSVESFSGNKWILNILSGKCFTYVLHQKLFLVSKDTFLGLAGKRVLECGEWTGSIIWRWQGRRLCKETVRSCLRRMVVHLGVSG